MFSTDFIFRQQENLIDIQKCQAGFRPLCNKILFLTLRFLTVSKTKLEDLMKIGMYDAGVLRKTNKK